MAANKKSDRRLVRQVVSSKRAPSGWTPMDIMEIDCKFMEVRKYSSEYFDVDTKFRRPNLQLISAYCLQNPFLWGQYILRREQMIQQLTKFDFTVKENDLFYSTDVENFEKIGRSNFDPRMEGNSGIGVAFHRDAFHAHQDSQLNTNPRLMYLAKVLVGTSGEKMPNSDSDPAACLKLNEKTGLPIDTLTDHSKTTFYKYNMCESYPEFLLVYRDTSMGPDIRSTQLLLKYAQISYRTGARFNPEQENTGVIQAADDTAKETKHLVKRNKKDKIKPVTKTGYINDACVESSIVNLEEDYKNKVNIHEEKESDTQKKNDMKNISDTKKKDDMKKENEMNAMKIGDVIKEKEIIPSVQCVNMMEKPIRVAVHIVRMDNNVGKKIDGTDNKHVECVDIEEEDDDVMKLMCRRKYPNYRRRNKKRQIGENIEMKEISPV